VVPLIIVKCCIWATALGSGTSGGVLAPLLIMGGGLGAVEAAFFPGHDPGLWPLVSMAAVLGGTMRSPLTGAIFALELTQDVNALPALLAASVVSYAFTVLVMKRSILTEKVARRGYHVSREYTVDPLERLSIGEVMTTEVVVIPGSLPVKELWGQYFSGIGHRKHQGYPVVDPGGQLLGVVTKSNLLNHWVAALARGTDRDELEIEPIITFDLIHRQPITAFPWESCRTAVERMAQAEVGRLVVVSEDNPEKVVGIVTRSDLLKPHARHGQEEGKRERFLGTSLIPRSSRRR
jgi:CBS domain-containing protein